MKKIVCTLSIYLLVLNTIFAQNVNFANSKVLILYGKNYTQNTKYTILNLNKSFFAYIRSLKGNEPSCDALKNKILAYDPDHYIFHFYVSSNPNPNINGYCTVKVGIEDKLIRIDSTMIIMSVTDHIKKYYCRASYKNPLRMSPSLRSKIINLKYSDCYFKCIEFKGNWIKVKSIDIDSESPSVVQYSGWLMWNNGVKIILDYPYIF